jgi:hypothetical protein
LQEPKLLTQLQEHWNSAVWPPPGKGGWQEWVVDALTRVKLFCQLTGKQHASDKVARERQLRAIVASAERLLETHPHNELLHERLNDAAQELVDKEQAALEWASIRSSAKWSQIEGRMDGKFFAHVSAATSSTPIQLLRDPADTEYTSTDEMACYANLYYQELFTTHGNSLECTTTREEVWLKVPQRVTAAMNSSLTMPITLDELHAVLKLLPSDKVLGPDGFQTNFHTMGHTGPGPVGSMPGGP